MAKSAGRAMTFVMHLIHFFFSLRTTLWSLGLMVGLMLAGAFVMPSHRAFQALHTSPLFQWIRNQPLTITWWLWGIIGLLVVMTLNTFFCSAESIVKKKKGTQWLLLISPQIIHIGFLFVLFAHLLSSIGAYQEVVYGREGTSLKIAEGNALLHIRDINITLDYFGYIADWYVDVEYISENITLQKDRIKPNKPSVFEGVNVNIKNLRSHPNPIILLQLNREPGALWALAGGILFMLGISTLIILKIKGER